MGEGGCFGRLAANPKGGGQQKEALTMGTSSGVSRQMCRVLVHLAGGYFHSKWVLLHSFFGDRARSRKTTQLSGWVSNQHNLASNRQIPGVWTLVCCGSRFPTPLPGKAHQCSTDGVSATFGVVATELDDTGRADGVPAGASRAPLP